MLPLRWGRRPSGGRRPHGEQGADASLLWRLPCRRCRVRAAKQPDAIKHNDGGRGAYFMDPAGHAMELITVPGGGWASSPHAPRAALPARGCGPRPLLVPHEIAAGALACQSLRTYRSAR